MNRRDAGILGVVIASATLAIIVAARRSGPPRPPGGGASAVGAPVEVTVFDDGIPYPDRWIVFHDAEGNVLSFAKSDESGKASAPVPHGGMVTVAYGSSVQHLRTVVGVEPGDRIVVGESEDEGHEGNATFRARVTLPGRHPGGAKYTLSAGVAETDVPNLAEPLTLSIMDRFTEGAGRTDAATSRRRFRLLAETRSETGEPLAFSFAWGEADVAPHPKTVDVSLPAWSTRYRPFTARLTNAPAGVTSVRGDLGVVAGGANRFVRPGRSASVGPETALRFLVPEPLGDDVALRIELAWNGDGKGVIARRQHADETMVVDLAAELLPRVSNATVERSGDPARPSVRWTVAGDAPAADASVLRLRWPATGEHEWTVVLPPTRREARLPALPPVLESWRPGARPIVPAVALVESSVYGTYEDVRAMGIDMAAEGIEDDEDGWLRWTAAGDVQF